ncbi:hypothetical protein ACO22_02942 [Paracoccidioides brasiliensis]|uniref:Uncharacterized protein n=1 Tax=Paracoccidioides brasiliensis TaxID=121759 RepID=A0A1D2JH90_PARBR|nr:hypothetical protein ACO22_02942 [Paracoccidioides brasiliensis]
MDHVPPEGRKQKVVKESSLLLPCSHGKSAITVPLWALDKLSPHHPPVISNEFRRPEILREGSRYRIEQLQRLYLCVRHQK